MAGGTTATHIKTFKFHDDQVKTIDAAIEKAKATSGTSVDSAALELICLDYVGGTGRAVVVQWSCGGERKCLTSKRAQPQQDLRKGAPISSLGRRPVRQPDRPAEKPRLAQPLLILPGALERSVCKRGHTHSTN